MKKQTPFFPFNKGRKPPSYIFKERNGKYHNILITHSREDKKRKNVPVYKNPDPKDENRTYVHKKVYDDPKNSIDRVFKNWKLHLFDKRKIKRIKKINKKRDSTC